MSRIKAWPPKGCTLIRAELTRPGDRIRFRMPGADYSVTSVDMDNIGHIRHKYNDDTAMTSYPPGDLLTVER